MKITVKPGNAMLPLSIEGIHYSTGKPVRMTVIGGIVAELNELKTIAHGQENIYIAPGLIDNQVNGFANVDFSGDDITTEGILKASESLLRVGVTTFIPTLITNSHTKLVKNFMILDEACRKYEIVEQCVPGFHLEGPYISPVDGYRGCHSPEHVRKPSWNEFEEYRKASGGRIIQVTVAPEVEGALDFIRQCTAEGLVVAIGHTAAGTAVINKAVENGARLSTHLGNGCANLIHRHDNPLWPQLDNDKLTATIIADGNHLLPEEIRVFLRAKTRERLLLTSDVIYLSGMPPGHYTFSGMNVILKEDGMLLNAEQNVLAGASFPLLRGVMNMMKFTGMSMGDAVDMASGNVARFYNINNKGRLEPGMDADIILIENKEGLLQIRQTFKRGIQY